MPLCDYLLANEEELASLSEAGNPYDLTRVDAKGFDILAIEALAKRLGVPSATPDGPPEVHGEDFEWFVQALTPPMVTALAGIADEDREQHAQALAAADVTDWDPGDLVRLLGDLRDMARRAGPEARGMFMWMST
jgi:hypothetical protein